MTVWTAPDGVLRTVSPEVAMLADLAKLRRNAEQVERLVKLGSFEVDLTTGVLTWSEGTYAIFGVPAGQPITVAEAMSFYDDEVRDRIAQHLEAAQASDEPYDLTVPFRNRAGELRWARMVAQVEAVAGSTRLFGVIRDITCERNTEEKLHQQAHQDVLTGLPNRRAFQLRLKQASASADRFGLCIVDVDRFKAVNDLHGHEGGDALLQTIATRLCSAVRSTDFVARLGGDEFAVVLVGLRTKVDLQRRVAAMTEAIREPAACAGHLLAPSASIGACLGRRRAGSEELLRQADAALYQAKLDGRDQFCLYQPHLLRKVDDHHRLIEDVRSGLQRGEFEVFYQPIVDLRTRIVRGWEALVRWRHPTKGLLLPGRFLGALADPKTSGAIDDFVLETSLRQMRDWLDRDIPVTCAGVNMSEAQLKRPDLFERIVSLLDRFRLTPDRLKIEVLETVLVGQATDAVAKTIERLADHGVVSALDDFGTGHASLTHLKRFKIERLKIDRSFVANLETDEHDQAIVRCLINLGRDLGVRITAEGIETVQQLSMLRQLGCDVGQGFLFGRPMPPDDVPGHLLRWYGREAAALFDGDRGRDRPCAVELDGFAAAS